MESPADPISTAILTACFAFFGGCGLLLVTELLVKPYVEHQQVIGEICYRLIFNENVIASASPEMTRDIPISKEVREMAARLRASVASFPPVVRWLPFIIRPDDVLEASRCLIGISNGMLTEQKDFEFIGKSLEKAKNLLRIPS
jgi:hypothetical protein